MNSSSAIAIALALSLSACASPAAKRDPRDPLEGYNRAIYRFNDALDRAVLKPVAQGYDAVVPGPVKIGVRNFFANLGEVVNFANDALQAKPEAAMTDFGRFLMNSTVGLGGIFDVATPAGMTRNQEDFGQTLGKWGVGSGPFFMLPFFGPSTVRDAIARPVDWPLQYPWYVEDFTWRASLYALETIDTRASLLGASTVLGEAALDPYIFLRDAYLQRRLRQVYDGNPPKSADDLEDEVEEAETKPAPGELRR